jgi:N-acetylmuramic acid 6-phosphate etherase
MNNTVKSVSTERIDPKFKDIDLWEDSRILSEILSAQFEALTHLQDILPQLESGAKQIVNRLSQDDRARIVYAGAGTPARICFQDGSELTPTYGWPTARIAYVVAGGVKALFQAVEGAEDDENDARAQIDALELKENDVFIAVSASGNTPFTVMGAQCARQKGAYVIAVTSNDSAALFDYADCKIYVDSGAEPVAGSTRMNAGTVQKVVLNLLSTLVMIRLGHVYEGLMVGLVPTNSKLKRRALQIIQKISFCNEEQARESLELSKGQVKLACLVARGVDPQKAEEILGSSGGDLRKAFILLDKAS